MADIRVYMTDNVPEAALEELGKLEGVTVTGQVILGNGAFDPDAGCVTISYDVPDAVEKGVLRIPLANVVAIDEGVHRAAMRRTEGLAGPGTT